MERFVAMQSGSEVSHKMTLRFQNGIFADMRALVPGGCTTLDGAVSLGDPTITVDSALPLPGRDDLAATVRVLIGSELYEVTDGYGTTTWNVNRHVDGTTEATALDEATVQVMRVFDIESAFDPDGGRSALELTCKERS